MRLHAVMSLISFEGRKEGRKA